MRHHPRRRRPHRADLRPARRRPRHRPPRRHTPAPPHRPRRRDRRRRSMSARELDAAGITDPALRDAYRTCRTLNARHGRTYFLATRLLPV
ncbi:hypothetical protein ACWEO9_31405, partial [Streptomyces albidoflavus]